MKVISLANRKGGIGRSTIACNLAAYFQQKGPTLLVDCDSSQGTATSWYAVRQQGKLDKGLSLTRAKDHDELLDALERGKNKYTFAIVDSPPRLHDMVQAAMEVSDLCLMPLAPIASEIWATLDTVEIAAAVRVDRPDLDIRLLWNRFRGYTRSAQELSEAVKKQMTVPQLKSRLALRVAYPDALAEGKSVLEWHDQAAREEMTALTKEVSRILGRK